MWHKILVVLMVFAHFVIAAAVARAAGQAQGPGSALTLTAQICLPREGVRRFKDAILSGDMISPKSINFTADGARVYINALESHATLVYSFPQLRQLAVIRHVFKDEDAPLFRDETTLFDYRYYNIPKQRNPNVFFGKPVEGAFSHGGRYFWTPYYRRDFDKNSSSPSAVAIVDTADNAIVRVMPTGPLPKVVTVSPDGRFVAVTHWGDNTIGIIDIAASEPSGFGYVRHLVAGERLDTSKITGDRDKNCGLCLRGTVFTPDSKYLLVGRMHGGGISGFSLDDGAYLGTVTAVCGSPRHLVIDPSGEYLYASSNRLGTISRAPLSDIVNALLQARGARVAGPDAETLRLNAAIRTIAIAPDGKNLYAAAHNVSKLLQVDIASWKVVRGVAVSPNPVGLGISPDGCYVAVTSQGEGLKKGNSVEFFSTVKMGK